MRPPKSAAVRRQASGMLATPPLPAYSTLPPFLPFVLPFVCLALNETIAASAAAADLL